MASSATSPYCLAIILSHPIQYYSPWFRHLTCTNSLRIKVFYLNNEGIKPTEDREFGKAFLWDTDLLSDYSYEFVPNQASKPGSHHFWGLRNPNLRTAIKRFKPDAILLFGYNYWTHLNLILCHPAPLIFRGDSTLLRPSPLRGLKRFILKLIYSRFTAFLCVGKANAAYLLHCGVPQSKIYKSPHCVDIKHFAPTSQRQVKAGDLRTSLGISGEEIVLLFSGKFIPKKRPDLLLNTFLKIAHHHPQSRLILSGDGELLPELLCAASKAGTISKRVHFLPFANQSEIPIRYLLGDVLVLETWGLSVNEAMHLGRPAIVSDRVGCHPDLIVHGKTGWVFRADDEAHFTQILHEVLSLSRSELAEKGRAAQAHAASYNYENATAGLLAALDSLPKKHSTTSGYKKLEYS